MFIDVLTIVLLMAACVLTAVGVLTILDRISWRRDMTPGRMAVATLAQERRLLRPDWAYYERHLQRPVPEAIRDFIAIAN